MKFTRDNSDVRREEGQVVVLFALASFVLVGAMALALDVGFLLSERRQAQSAADAAALAGGVAVLRGESSASARAAAIDYAVENGVSVTGAEAGSIAVNITGDRKNGRVEVDVAHPVQRFLVGAIYTGDWSVTASAVAEIHDDRDADYALITLEPPGTVFNGNNGIVINDGSAMTNDSVNANPSNSHYFVVGGTIDAAGNVVNANGNWDAPDGMNNNVVPIDDPLAGSVPPNPGLYEEREPACDGGCTWLPGVYRNDNFTITGTVTFAPGVYYFDNFDLEFQNTNSRIQGNGVMLYFDDDSTFEPKNGEMYVTAPPSSPYAGGPDGMVFWMANCTTIESRGNTDYYFEGIYYAPCSTLVFRGTPQSPVNNGQMVIGSIDMRGTANIDIQYGEYFETRRYELFLVE